MKKSVFLLLFVLCLSFYNLLSAQTGTVEMQVVQKFMTYSLLPEGSKSIPDDIKAKRKALISPAFLKSKKATDAKYLVNMYVPHGFKVEHNTGSEVHVYIWGLYGSWKHELFFKVEQENGSYYIIPSADAEISKYNMFDPWIRVVKNSSFDKAIMQQP